MVAVLACWFAARRHASPLWTSIVATVTLLLLLTGVAGAFFTTGTERAFWVGFALFGISYLVLVNWDWVGGQFGHDLSANLSDLAEFAFPAPAPAKIAQGVGSNAVTRPYGVPGEASRVRMVRVGNFVQVCRLTLSVMFALLGGFVAHGFAARSAARSDS
ncbi:MAG: hypothetical protein P4L84_14310 [Isosphaeraceae bacterium]|nr:hypothetical protein [Isosphaeraceae bacterium]